MSSHIYKQLLNRKIEDFVNVFEHDSKSIFRNVSGKIIHPGEYGMYKEKAFKQLLNSFLTKDFSVGDGFIITSTDKVSTQCDIVIYDSSTAPLIQNSLTQLFPIEIVKGICEVKSVLNKSDFIEALVKLSKIKELSDELEDDFANAKCMRNCAYIPTFLVCSKLNFNFTDIELEDIYCDIPRKYWHNAILSLEDGLIQYIYNVKDLGPQLRNVFDMDTPADLVNSVDSGYAILEYWDNAEMRECFYTSKSIEKANEDYEHIFSFLANLDLITREHEYFEFDNLKYLGFDYKNGAVNIRKRDNQI